MDIKLLDSCSCNHRNLAVTATSPVGRGLQPIGYAVTPVTPIFFKNKKN